LNEVDARRARPETLASIVQKEEADARSRVAGLVATKGRIQVAPGTPPRAAQVDASEPRLAGFVAWVTPGQHIVTFGPGTPDSESKTVEVKAGETVEIEPSPPAAPAPAPSATPGAGALPSATASEAAPQAPPPRYLRDETDHPFSAVFIVVGGGVALAWGIAAVPLESHAGTLHDRFVAEQQATGAIPPDDRQTFSSARTWGYTALGAAVGFGALTAGLVGWYFLGTSHREVVVTPGVSPERSGASFGLHGRF